MDYIYVLSQISVILGMTFLGISYLCKNKKTITLVGIISVIFYSLQYLFLGALAGFAINIINVVRSIWFYINAKNNKKNNIYVLIILMFLLIISSIITYNNLFSLIPALAAIIFTYSIWQDNIKVYRWLSLPISLCWITYNFSVKSVFGVICELTLLVIEIVGVIKISKNNKK